MGEKERETEREREGRKRKKEAPATISDASTLLPSPARTSPPLVISATCPLRHHVCCRPDSHREKDQTVAMEIVCVLLCITLTTSSPTPYPFQIFMPPPEPFILVI